MTFDDESVSATIRKLSLAVEDARRNWQEVRTQAESDWAWHELMAAEARLRLYLADISRRRKKGGAA